MITIMIIKQSTRFISPRQAPNICFLFLFLFISSFLMLTGCNPSSSFVLSDNASLKKLNELEKERPVLVTTLDSIYVGENIKITRDSTTLQNFTFKPKVVSYSSMKKIQYDSGSTKEGTIELKDNQVFKANEIYISNKDSIIRFNKIITALFVFPTKDITRIQKVDKDDTFFARVAIGTIGGMALGTTLGFVVSRNSKEVSNSGEHSDDLGPVMILLGTCTGGLTGLGIGLGLAESFGQKDDIYITYQFENKSP